MQLWSTDGRLLGSLSLQTDVTFTSKHLDQTKMYNTGSERTREVAFEVLLCVFSGDMCGLLPCCAIRGCWNSFRSRALCWPEEGAAAPADTRSPSWPLCGSDSASIAIPKRFIYFVQMSVEKAKCLCAFQVLLFYSFDQEGHYLFIGASDSHVFVVNAKPSEGFSVLGYTGRYCL